MTICPTIQQYSHNGLLLRSRMLIWRLSVYYDINSLQAGVIKFWVFRLFNTTYSTYLHCWSVVGLGKMISVASVETSHQPSRILPFTSIAFIFPCNASLKQIFNLRYRFRFFSKGGHATPVKLDVASGVPPRADKNFGRCAVTRRLWHY